MLNFSKKTDLTKALLQEKNIVNYYNQFETNIKESLETYIEEFKNVSDELLLATDDGSYGKNGFAINFLKEDIEKGKIDSIYACGPLPMLRAVKKLAEETGIPAQVSLEEKMGCGMGVCLGCAVKTASSPKDNPSYVYVCKTGPVFDSSFVEF